MAAHFSRGSIMVKKAFSPLSTLALCATGLFAAGGYDVDTGVVMPDEAKYGPRLELIPVEGPKSAMGMARRGNLLFTAGGGSLWVFDISDPLAPKKIGKLDGFSEERQMALAGDVACITARAHGLYLVDISDPTKPKHILRYDTIELATGIDTVGTLVFVGLRTYGVETIDISDPKHPRTLSIIKTHEAQSQVYDHQKLYVGDWGAARLTILDMANPCEPKFIADEQLYGLGDGLDVRGNLVVASSGHHRRIGPKEGRSNAGHALTFIDITNVAKPKTHSYFAFPPFYALGDDYWTNRIAGNTAVCADTFNGVFFVDFSDVKNPKGTGWAHLPELEHRGKMIPDAAASVVIGDGVAYIGGKRSGLFMIKRPGMKPDKTDHGAAPVIPPPKPQKIPAGFHQYDAKGQVRAVSMQGNVAWAACSHAGLHAVRVTKNGFKLLKKSPIPLCYDVKCVDGLLYTAEGENGLAVYRPEKDFSLTELGRVQLPNKHIAQLVWKPSGLPYCVASARGGFIYI